MHTTSSLTSALALLTNAELDAMARRAYAGAARAWIELNRYTAPRGTPPEDCRAVRAALYDDAVELDAWYDTLRAEQDRRAMHPGPPDALAHDYGMPCACPDCTGADADRYAEAIAGARAMRSRAVTWADGGPGADADERAHGIPERQP